MLTLALETCLDPASLALERADSETFQAAAPVIFIGPPGARATDGLLVAAVAELAAQLSVGVGAINRLIVSVGPGTFTGQRVGLALAQGLQAATNADVFAVTSLQAIALGVLEPDASEAGAFADAEPSPGADGALIVVEDAKRGDVYVQAFDQNARACSNCHLTRRDGFADWLAAFAPRASSVTGSGMTSLGLDAGPDGWAAVAGFGPLKSLRSPTPQNGYALRLLTAPERLRLAPVSKIRPIYLRSPDAAPARVELKRVGSEA